MLGKRKKSTENAIVTIDPYLETAFKFSGNEVEILDPTKDKNYKTNFYVSYLKLKHLTTSIVEVPRSIGEDDLANVISIKIYEELSLDAAVDYKISYIEVPNSSGETRSFSVFAIDSESIAKIFQPVVNSVKYIDYVVLAPLLYGAAYKKNLLANNEVDCFINISKDDAFLTIYQAGEYFVTRPLRYSLSYIKDKFCEQTGERLSEQGFITALKQHGLNGEDENSTFSKMLSYVIDDCFSYVSDIINSVSRIYGLTIANVYLDVETGQVKGLADYVGKKLEINTKDLAINLAINSREFNISQQHNLMAIEAKDYQENLNDEFNFSVFKRPAPFMQRHSGKFIMTIAGALILSLAYPIFNYGYGYFLQHNADIKQEEYDVLSALERDIKNKLAAIAKEQESTRAAVKSEEERLSFRKKLLQEIYDKKNNYKMKSIILSDLSALLDKNDVKLKEISGGNEKIVLTVKSDNDKKITELIKDISDEQGKFSVSTKEIRQIPGIKKSFESNISVELK